MSIESFAMVVFCAYAALALFFGYEHVKYNHIEAELRKEISQCAR